MKYKSSSKKIIFALMLPNYFLISCFFLISLFSYSQDTHYPEHCLVDYNENDSESLKELKDYLYNSKYINSPKESLSLALEHLEDAKLTNDIEVQIYSYKLLAIINNKANKKIEALNYLTKGYSIVVEEGLKSEMYAISIMSDYAFFLNETSQFDEALKIYIEISELMKLSCPNPNIDRFLNYKNIAGIYFIKQDYKNALLVYQKAYNEAKLLNNKLWLSSSLNNIGLFYSKKHGKVDLDKAVHYYLRAKEELNLELKEHKIFDANIDENIGYIETLNKDYKKAYFFYQKASVSFRENENFIDASRTDIKKYNCLLLLKDYKKLKKLDDSLSVFFSSEKNRKSDATEYGLYLKLKLKYLNKINNLEDYIVVSNQYQDYLNYKIEYKETLDKSVFDGYVGLIQSNYRKKIKLERRIALLKQKELTQKHYYTCGVLLIIILVLFLLFKVRASKVKQVEQENEITKLTLENTTLEKKILNQKLESKDKDITSIITDKKVRANFLKLLLERIELFFKKNTDKKDANLLSIINDIKSQIALENRLSVLESDIVNVNNSFDVIIRERYPLLSKTEREVCAFIKLNLSIKETAVIRGVSQDSVRMVRSRIRKKLKLNPKEELDKYIQSI
jgi:DNA-binding CsgD family transcriptional regulator/tetratricopeptide (TPR) repeat protein